MIVLNWVTYLNELFSDFPAEDSRVFLLVLLDLILHLWSGHSRLGSTNHSGSDWTSLLIPELKHFWSKHAHTRGFRPGFRPGIRQQAMSLTCWVFLRRSRVRPWVALKWHRAWHRPRPSQWSWVWCGWAGGVHWWKPRPTGWHGLALLGEDKIS